MAFAVIKFKKTDEVAVVPVNWINDDKCFWPPKKLEARILQHIDKNLTASQSWDLHPIQTLGVFANYNEARVKLSVAEEKSDLNTTDPEEKGRGKRKKRQRVVSSSDESEDTCWYSQKLQEPPVFPSPFERMENRPNIVKLSQRIGSQENDSFTLSSLSENNEDNFSHSESLLNKNSIKKNVVATYPAEPFMNVLNNSTPKQNSDSTGLSAFQRTLLREINIIKSNQKHIIETMGCILKTIGRMEKNDVDEGNCSLIEGVINLMPVSHLNDFNKIEELLDDENAYNQMINYLQKVGGKDYEKSVKYMLKKILTDGFASSFSFLGIRGKMPFKPTKTYKLIMSAVRTHPLWRENSETEVAKVISNWLRHASTRTKKKNDIIFVK